MSSRSLFLILVFASFVTAIALSQANTASDQWKPVETALGRSGKSQPDGAYKFAFPRGDMKVTVAGTEVKAGLALGSWVAFNHPGDNAMVMGDLVLAESEVEPVMQKLAQGDIEITALHNHVLQESPRVMYMHIQGHGDATKLAQAIHQALALTKTPPATPPPASPPQLSFDTAQIDQTLGRKGTNNNGVYQVSAPRAESITANGMTIPGSMGLATALNFQPTGNGRAAITGDFVLIGSEVNPVLRALRENGINVTAVHSHMLDEQPRLFFMHFWANDDAVKLAKGLRAALDKTNSKPAQ